MANVLEIASLVVLLCYYVGAYIKARRRSEEHPLVVRFEPAAGLSPAVARYVWKGCVDQRTVASVFAQLAVKGLINIEPVSNGAYHITRTKPSGALPAIAREEQVALDWLFSNFLTENNFNPQHDSQGCVSALTGALQKQTGSLYYSTHYGYVAFGTLLSLLCVFASARFQLSHDRAGIYILTWVTFWTVLLATIVIWQTLIASVVDLINDIGDWSRLLFGIFVSSFVLAALVAVSLRLKNIASSEFVAWVIAMSALGPLASMFLKNITDRGAELKWQLVGFREFLMAAEQDRLNRMHMPHEALRSNEQNLAYAIALEVKEGWGDEFANACHPQFA